MIKIIGCGNILRQDDGIGVYVIEELRKIPLSENVELIDAGTRSFDMVSFLEGAEKIIIVDAVKNHGKPGDIYRMDIDTEKIAPDQLKFVSTHEFNFEDTLAVSKKILGEQFPKKITFIGVEVENTESGLGLSPSLKESLRKVVSLVHKETRRGDLGRPILQGRTSKLVPTRHPTLLRKHSIRLKTWDYFLPGPYFFTICTFQREEIFVSESIREKAIEMFKNIANELNIIIHSIAIAVDHLHSLITLSNDRKINLWQYIGKVKVKITQEIRKGELARPTSEEGQIGQASLPLQVWQRSFHDHVIRNEKDFLEKAKYIENHPFKEKSDVYCEWH